MTSAGPARRPAWAGARLAPVAVVGLTVAALVAAACGGASDGTDRPGRPSTDRGGPRWSRPTSYSGAPLRFGDLILFTEDGLARLGDIGPNPRSGAPVAAATALLLASDRGSASGELPDVVRADLTRQVDEVVAGRNDETVALAEAITFERLTDGEVVVLTPDDRARLEEHFAARPTADDPELSSTLLLRIELALRASDAAQAERIARLPGPWACTLVETTAMDPEVALALLTYELAQPHEACVEAGRDALLTRVRGRMGGDAATALVRSGAATDPGVQDDLVAWLERQQTTHAQRGYSPDEIDRHVPAVLGTGIEPPALLASSARRVADLAGFIGDVSSSAYSLDTFLLASFDEATGFPVWAPAGSSATQVDDAGGWPALFVEGAGTAREDPTFPALVAQLEAGCDVTDPVERPLDVVPPFAIIVVVGLELVGEPCRSLDPLTVLAEVADSPSMPTASTDVVRSWAAAYVACRYVEDPADEAALLDAVRRRPTTAAAEWDVVAAPTEYFPLFDAYAAGWLDALLHGDEDCRTLTPWAGAS